MLLCSWHRLVKKIKFIPQARSIILQNFCFFFIFAQYSVAWPSTDTITGWEEKLLFMSSLSYNYIKSYTTWKFHKNSPDFRNYLFSQIEILHKKLRLVIAPLLNLFQVSNTKHHPDGHIPLLNHFINFIWIFSTKKLVIR